MRSYSPNGMGTIILTFKLALVTTLLLFFVATPIAAWLYRSKSKLKPIAEALIGMPLILPPTVIGFYLLLIFSPNNGIGKFLHDSLGLEIAFSFKGLVIASMIYSLPFMVYPLYAGMNQLSRSMIESSFILGKSKLQTLLKVMLPNMKRSILAAVILTFAHTIGEFGVVLMIGGNRPNITRVASIAIYDQVEALNYANAHKYSLLLFALSFTILIAVYFLNNRSFQWKKA